MHSARCFVLITGITMLNRTAFHQKGSIVGFGADQQFFEPIPSRVTGREAAPRRPGAVCIEICDIQMPKGSPSVGRSLARGAAQRRHPSQARLEKAQVCCSTPVENVRSVVSSSESLPTKKGRDRRVFATGEIMLVTGISPCQSIHARCNQRLPPVFLMQTGMLLLSFSR